MPLIRVLPPLVVNQIAAGEVVERPASVVKELVDNALDAGATTITLDLEAGGIELIAVTDDGVGLAEDDLPLAIHPHATSKIQSAQDLDEIATMGFRGEALASIASVSRLTIRSRRREDTAAAELSVDGGTPSPIKPAAAPPGTRVTVRNLFYNTPARRKFLRTPQTEQGHALAIFKELSLSHPRVAFRATANGKRLLDLPPNQSPRDRALAVIGAELSTEMVEVSPDNDPLNNRGVTLWGLAGLPAIAKSNAKHQHVFLNGRPIRDKTIQHAIKEAYRGLIEPGKHPVIFLLMEMDPRGVDVNVHPAKTEVRFRDQSAVHRAVNLSIREALRAKDLTPIAGGANPGVRFAPISSAPATFTEPAPDLLEAERRFVDAFKSATPNSETTRFEFEGVKQALASERQRLEAERQHLESQRQQVAEIKAAALASEHLRPSRLRDADGQSTMPAPSPITQMLSLHNAFLVTQDEQGLVIIDQHALHERVMYERLMARITTADRLESQRMLVPPVLELDAQRAQALDALTPTLEKLGVSINTLTPTTAAIQEFPSFLFERGVDALDFLDEVLDHAINEGFDPGLEGMLHEVLDMMACKAAVKAGDKLTAEDAAELLKLRDEVTRSSNCPHGRPTAIRVTVSELERQFGR